MDLRARRRQKATEAGDVPCTTRNALRELLVPSQLAPAGEVGSRTAPTPSGGWRHRCSRVGGDLPGRPRLHPAIANTARLSRVSPTGVSGPHPVSSTPAILPGLTLPRQRTPVRIGSAQFERDRFLDFGSNARQRAALPPPRELSRLGQVLHYDARIAADHARSWRGLRHHGTDVQADPCRPVVRDRPRTSRRPAGSPHAKGRVVHRTGAGRLRSQARWLQPVGLPGHPWVTSDFHRRCRAWHGRPRKRPQQPVRILGRQRRARRPCMTGTARGAPAAHPRPLRGSGRCSVRGRR